MNDIPDGFPEELEPYVPTDLEIPHHSDDPRRQEAFREGYIISVAYERMMEAEDWPEHERERFRQTYKQAARQGARVGKALQKGKSLLRNAGFAFKKLFLIQN